MIVIKPQNMVDEEVQVYVAYLEKKYNRKITKLAITLDGEEVNLNYEFEHIPFERIRRITGYLVGTMDKWNDAKTAEEHDREKHNIENLEELSLN